MKPVTVNADWIDRQRRITQIVDELPQLSDTDFLTLCDELRQWFADIRRKLEG